MLIDYKEIELNELEINLPTSKSISNRALIIQQLCLESILLENLSEAEDTKILQALLQDKGSEKDVGMAGTVARFLSAYLATQNTTYLLNGSERMQIRPMNILLDALEILGAEIKYLGKVGFLPVQINGSKITGGKLALDASVSSQFISALMMIAPSLKQGLEIELLGTPCSKPYIIMTQKLMEHFGIQLTVKENTISIPAQNYHQNTLRIEGDWSSAAYFYSALALADEGSLVLKNLSFDSWQGDSIVSDIYYRLGIKTSLWEDDILLEKSEHVIAYLEYDFSDCPDLAQTVICTCVGLGIEGMFIGLQTLRNKETDRIKALQNELIKFDWQLIEKKKNHFELSRRQEIYKEAILIDTYHDHRMAMAFAPLAIILGPFGVKNAEVVKKSFPQFWNELEKIGIH